MENHQSFLKRLEGRLTAEEILTVDMAYDFAKLAHKNQERDDGTRYFEHARAGALILTDELGIYDPDLLVTFFLHDTGEDTPLFGNITRSNDVFVRVASFRLKKAFNEQVADNFIRLTKPFIDHVWFKTKEEMLTFYYQRLCESEDAILLKSVDRLHNLRSLPGNDPKKIARQIKETEEIYLPIFNSVSGKLAPYAKVIITKIEDQLAILKSNQQNT